MATRTTPEQNERRIELPTGIRMRSLEIGRRDGEPVLMLHGYTDTSRAHRPLAVHLARLRPELRLVLADHRGHGGSSMPPAEVFRGAPERAFRVEHFAEDAIALLDALGIARAHVVGHSLGSFVAQELALAHPERVRSIVLIGSAAKCKGNPAIERFVLAETVEGRWKRALEQKGYRFPDDVYGRTPLDADPDAEDWILHNWGAEPRAEPGFARQLARDTAHVPLGTGLGAGRGVLEMDNRARLPGLAVPTLVVSGSEDTICPVEPDQRELREALEAAARRGLRFEWRQYAEYEHSPHWAIPEAIARDIAGFLPRASVVPRAGAAVRA